jgi:glycosyltransferase involved in cell wall biosynthesis
MKRIVFSNFDDLRNPFYGGGGAAAIHEIARRLAARQHQVMVLTGKYPGSRNEVVDGVSYERIGSTRLGPKFGQVIFHFSLPRKVRQLEFDFWVESLTPPFSTACLQLFTKKPVALVTQLLAGQSMAKKYKLPFHWIERIGLKTYRFGIAVSEPIRSELLAANPRMQAEVIPNGVDPELISQVVHNEGRHILFLGRISIQHKGLDLLLSAFHQASQKSAVPLVIAGAGLASDETLLKRRIKELGLGSRIELLGKVSGEQKAQAFRGAMFMVMPSRFEGFPLTLLEAFCWQLPVVLYSIPELDWLPESCCVKVKPFDVEGLANAMLLLAGDENRRRRMGETAKSWVRQFSWETLAERYENFIARVLSVQQKQKRREVI